MATDWLNGGHICPSCFRDVSNLPFKSQKYHKSRKCGKKWSVTAELHPHLQLPQNCQDTAPDPASPEVPDTGVDFNPKQLSSVHIPREGSVKAYQEILQQPVYDGAQVTLKDHLIKVFRIYAFDKMTRQNFETNILQGFRDFVAHLNPKIPASLHLVRSALGVPSPDDMELHICPCDGHVYDYVPKEQWNSKSIKRNQCPQCNESRFYLNKEGNVTKPKKVLYRFPLEKQLQRLFRNPEFVRFRGKGREPDNPDSFYGAQHMEWLSEVTKGEILDPLNSSYSIGFDWCKANNTKEHSFGVVSLRCDDLPVDVPNRDSFVMPLMIIPGPKEPSNLNPYFNIIGREFNSINRKGLRVKYRDESGQMKKIRHKAFWCFIDCDAVARTKFGCFNGAIAQFCCPFCRLPSSNFRGEGGNVFKKPLGYDIPVVHEHSFPLLDNEKNGPVSYQMGVEDEKRKLSNEDMKRRSDILLEAANNSRKYKDLQKQLGCNGVCEVFDIVPTLHRVNSYVLPFYHLIFLGVIKSFFSALVTDKKKKKKRGTKGRKRKREEDMGELSVSENCNGQEDNSKDYRIKNINALKALNKSIVLSNDFGRAFRCLSTIKAFLIEDMKNLWAYQASLLLNKDLCEELKIDILNDGARKAWGLLRRAISYYMDDSISVTDKEQAEDAQKALLEFAKFCEQDLPSVCTQNLHVLLCRIQDQERAVGKARYRNELYIERSLQFFKQNTESKEYPERSSVRRLLDQYFVQDYDYQMSNPNEMLKDKPRSRHPSKDCNDSKTYFSDKGRIPNSHDMGQIKYYCDMQGICPENFHIYVHHKAQISHHTKVGNVGKVCCKRWKRERKKKSSIVVFNNTLAAPIVGDINYFFRMKAKIGTEVGKTVHRVAVYDKFRHVSLVSDDDTGHLLKVTMDRRAKTETYERDCFAEIDDIHSKVAQLSTRLLGSKCKQLETPKSKYIDYFVPLRYNWVKNLS